MVIIVKSHNFKTQNKKNRNRRKKITQSFKPDLSKPDMKLIIQFTNKDKFMGNMTENDVVILPNHFDDNSIYQKLLDEINNCGIANDDLWKLLYITHFIADDRLVFKKLKGIDWKKSVLLLTWLFQYEKLL